MMALTACRFAFLASSQARRALLPIVPGTRNAAFARPAVNETTAALIDSEWAVIDGSTVRADSYGPRPFVRLIGFHEPYGSPLDCSRQQRSSTLRRFGPRLRFARSCLGGRFRSLG